MLKRIIYVAVFVVFLFGFTSTKVNAFEKEFGLVNDSNTSGKYYISKKGNTNNLDLENLDIDVSGIIPYETSKFQLTREVTKDGNIVKHLLFNYEGENFNNLKIKANPFVKAKKFLNRKFTVLLDDKEVGVFYFNDQLNNKFIINGFNKPNLNVINDTNSKKNIFIDIDKLITNKELTDKIKEHFKATLTNFKDIEILKSSYENSLKVGEYQVVFNVVTTDNKKIEKKLNVVVIDVAGPKVKELRKITQPNNKSVSIITYLQNLQATDNVSKKEKISFSFPMGRFYFEFTAIGNHKVPLVVQDEAGNKTNYDINVEIIDKVSPKVIGPKAIIKCAGVDFNSSDIIKLFKATDEGKVITSDIKVDEDTFKGNENNIGNYKIKLSVSDKAKNIGLHEVNITVREKIEGVLFVEDNIVHTDKRFNDKFILDVAKALGKTTSNDEKLYKIIKFSPNSSKDKQTTKVTITENESKKAIELNFKVDVRKDDSKAKEALNTKKNEFYKEPLFIILVSVMGVIGVGIVVVVVVKCSKKKRSNKVE